jgi:hypothetical protein
MKHLWLYKNKGVYSALFTGADVEDGIDAVELRILDGKACYVMTDRRSTKAWANSVRNSSG